MNMRLAALLCAGMALLVACKRTSFGVKSGAYDDVTVAELSAQKAKKNGKKVEVDFAAYVSTDLISKDSEIDRALKGRAYFQVNAATGGITDVYVVLTQDVDTDFLKEYLRAFGSFQPGIPFTVWGTAFTAKIADGQDIIYLVPDRIQFQ